MDIFKLDSHIGKYILVGQVGSKSYGTDTPESDDDFVGVAVAPLSHYTGLDHWENDGTLEIKRKETHNAEIVIFELKKFLKLCLAFNPNVIPLLYLREQDYTTKLTGGQMLIDNRDAFTSRRAYKTLIGYAEFQRHTVTECNTGKLGQKRKELVAKFGYDVKYASHTIRILRMGIEFFDTGKLNVYRTWDQEELKDIRNGKWPLDKWLKLVDSLLNEAKFCESRNLLPEKSDYNRVNWMCMRLVDMYVTGN